MTWVDREYANTFFSINSVQAAQTNFSEFNASAGFKDIGTGVYVMYFVDKHWVVNGGLKITQLLGDAADSSISKIDTSLSMFLGFSYKIL